MAENGLNELKSKRTPKRKSFPDENYVVVPKKSSYKRKAVIVNKSKETSNTQPNVLKSKGKLAFVDARLKKKKSVSTSNKHQLEEKKLHLEENISAKKSLPKKVTNNNPLKRCPKATCKSTRPVCFAKGSKS